MPMKRLLLLSFLLFVISAQNTNANPIPTGGTSLYDEPQPMAFSHDGSTIATVECDVFEYESTPFEYVYTYQITNDSAAGLSWFSVKIDGVGVCDDPAPDFADGTGVEPDDWRIVNSPGQSVEGVFYSTIGSSESSAVLWFASDYGPGLGEGALVGLSSDYVFATGPLLVPIPEPATLVLLVAGGLIAFTRKRRPG